MLGFLTVLLLIGVVYLFSRVRSLERAIARINKQLYELTSGQPTEQAAGDHVTSTTPEPSQPPATAAETTATAAAETTPAAVSVPKSGWQTQSRTPRSPTPFDKLIDLIKRYFTEGNLIVRVGIIVLFAGVAFLLDYARKHSMLPIEFRVAGAGLIGVVVLILGWRLREKRRAYALVMQGGGVGVLYLTLFAALQLYHLLPATWVFIFLVLMVVLSAALAVMQNARSLAVLAISGGFLAPVLTSTGGGSHIGLFSFYAVLNIGILVIAWFKSWRMLNVLGFVFTFVIGTAWGVMRYRADYFVSTEVFLILFFLFYVAIALLFARQQAPNLKAYVDGTIVFGVPLVAFSLQSGLVYRFEYGLAWSSFCLGAFYMLLATQCWRFGAQRYRLLSEACLALGVVFASLTIPFALEGEWIATAWALEGAGIVWISVRQQRRMGVAFALLLQLGAGLGFLIEAHSRSANWPVLNSVFLGAALVALAGLFSSYYLSRHYAKEKRWENIAALLALIWGLLWWFFNGFVEIDRYAARAYDTAIVIAFVAVSAAALGLLEWRLRWTMLRHTVTGLTVFMVLIVMVVIADFSHPFAEYTYYAWPLLFGVCYALLKQRDRELATDSELQFSALPYLHAIVWWLLALLLAVEWSWLLQWRAKLEPAWVIAGNALMIVVLCWIVIKARIWPWDVHRKSYLGWGLAPLMVFLLLWSLFINTGSTGSMQPLSYLPVLNPLDIMQLIVLMTLFSWWQCLRAAKLALWPDRYCWTVLSAVGFVWLNVVLLRSLHQWADISYKLDSLWQSILVQASLSVFWTIIGLGVMIIAAREQWRSVWIAAAALLGLVVVKLFFNDLAERDSLAAIASYIVVGILLLVVGYFSPLPPKRKVQEA